MQKLVFVIRDGGRGRGAGLAWRNLVIIICCHSTGSHSSVTPPPTCRSIPSSHRTPLSGLSRQLEKSIAQSRQAAERAKRETEAMASTEVRI